MAIKTQLGFIFSPHHFRATHIIIICNNSVVRSIILVYCDSYG